MKSYIPFASLSDGCMYRCIRGFAWTRDERTDWMFNAVGFQALLLENYEDVCFFLCDDGRIIQLIDYHENGTIWINLEEK